MEPTIQKKLLEINRAFYDHFDGSFSATRGHVQPGVDKLLKQFDQDVNVLDVGCGNGTLARLEVRGVYRVVPGCGYECRLARKSEKATGLSIRQSF